MCASATMLLHPPRNDQQGATLKRKYLQKGATLKIKYLPLSEENLFVSTFFNKAVFCLSNIYVIKFSRTYHKNLGYST